MVWSLDEPDSETVDEFPCNIIAKPGLIVLVDTFTLSLSTQHCFMQYSTWNVSEIDPLSKGQDGSNCTHCRFNEHEISSSRWQRFTCTSPVPMSLISQRLPPVSELYYLHTPTIVRAGIAQPVSALDWLSLRCAAIITLRVRTQAWAPKEGTLPHLLQLWTEM